MPEESPDKHRPHYRRVILKLSGESLAHTGERGISMDEVTVIAKQVKQAHALGCQLAVVVGGGNILRGAQFKGSSGEMIQEATAHYMGMLATVINALAMQDALESIGCATRVMSANKMDGVAEPFIRRPAIRHL
jgi:uridylate kinase